MRGFEREGLGWKMSGYALGTGLKMSGYALGTGCQGGRCRATPSVQGVRVQGVRVSGVGNYYTFLKFGWSGLPASHSLGEGWSLARFLFS